MKYIFDSYNHVICLEKGENLAESLATFFNETKHEGGWIEGVGGALSVELGYYNLEKKEYQWRTFDQTLEVLSLQGTVALNESGEPVFHLHGVFSDENYQTIGGHVKNLTVGGTLELFVHRSYTPLKRTLNPGTGLQTLSL